ncbi:MAG: hypothetical protein IPP99_03070 [Chitinophagaceae bacterium]|nr:hypothetical protein [Chitinophagaceae bacterium]
MVDEDLRSYFAKYGEVISTQVYADKYTKRTAGLVLLK